MYVTPETFTTEGFLKNMRIVYEQGELNRLVVDEVRIHPPILIMGCRY